MKSAVVVPPNNSYSMTNYTLDCATYVVYYYKKYNYKAFLPASHNKLSSMR